MGDDSWEAAVNMLSELQHDGVGLDRDVTAHAMQSFQREGKWELALQLLSIFHYLLLLFLLVSFTLIGVVWTEFEP